MEVSYRGESNDSNSDPTKTEFSSIPAEAQENMTSTRKKFWYFKIWKNNLKYIREKLPVYKPSSLDIWALGISIVLNGQYTGWNYGFTAGFVPFSISYLLHGFANVILVCSISEMASCLPFAGDTTEFNLKN